MSRHGVRHWLFQANPERYRIFESLRREAAEEWNLNQHAREVARGDRVGIWICGPEAGLYATGTVLNDPIMRSDTANGIGYWANPADGRRARPRVTVRYDRTFLDRPLLKPYIASDPDLQGIQILHFPRATNFPLSEEEWMAIQAWINDT